MPAGSHKITGLTLDPTLFESEHKIEDEDLKVIVNSGCTTIFLFSFDTLVFLNCCAKILIFDIITNQKLLASGVNPNKKKKKKAGTGSGDAKPKAAVGQNGENEC